MGRTLVRLSIRSLSLREWDMGERDLDLTLIGERDLERHLGERECERRRGERRLGEREGERRLGERLLGEREGEVCVCLLYGDRGLECLLGDFIE